MTRLKLLAVMAALALASPAVAQEPVAMETCEMCHDDVAPVFAAGAHGRAMAKIDRAILDRSCVGCHGPATEHIDDPTTVESLEIKIYYTSAEVEGLIEENLRIYWWTGQKWEPCSRSGVNTADVDGFSGYLWAIITADTSPSLFDLSGTPFGANSVEKPVGGTFDDIEPSEILVKVFLIRYWLPLTVFVAVLLGLALGFHTKKPR